MKHSFCLVLKTNFTLVILFSVGFTSAKVLATKIVYLYNLSNSQLSQQDHYDFGMRAIKAVLLMAGEIKRSHIKDPDLTDEQSEVREQLSFFK